MCLTALEASQANNKLEIPADPLWVQGESLEACPKSTLDPRSFSDIRTYQVPLRVQARPKVLLRHPHLPSPSSSPSSTRGPSPISATARSFSDYIKSGIIHSDIQLEQNYSTSWRPRPTKVSAKTPASTLDTAQRQDSLTHKVNYAVRLSSRSKCFSTPISVGTVIDSGGYLYISIPTIKHCNLSS